MSQKTYGAVETETGTLYLCHCTKQKKRAILFSRTQRIDYGYVPCMLTVEDAKKLRLLLKKFIKASS